MRNSLGQKIEVGTPVVMITQDNDVKVGKVYMFNSSDYPRIEWTDGKKSPPIVKWFRLVVISDTDYDTFVGAEAVRKEARKAFDAMHPHPPMPRDTGAGRNYNRLDWEAYRDAQAKRNSARKEYIDNALLAKGYEPYYAD